MGGVRFSLHLTLV
jgi:hypothetical protein